MADGIKQLIISPHADDEVLGCGGILDSSSHVYYCGLDETLVAPDPAHRIPLPAKEIEIAAVAKFLGFEYEWNREAKVNHYKEQDFIGKFEELINRTRPQTVFVSHPGYNQDHRTVYNALFVALRPHDKNYFVKRVLVYEAVHDVIWDPADFRPNYFVPIDIERKLEGYRQYKSQVRSFRSTETLKMIAGVRGKMANVDYAEAFSVVRYVT